MEIGYIETFGILETTIFLHIGDRCLRLFNSEDSHVDLSHPEAEYELWEGHVAVDRNQYPHGTIGYGQFDINKPTFSIELVS